MSDFKYVLLLSVICAQITEYSPSFIYQIVNGSLSDSGAINLSIYSISSTGVILYCIDSDGIKFAIKIIKISNNVKGFRLEVNATYKVVPFKDLCKCDPCEGSKIEFNIKFNKTIMYTRCNNTDWVTYDKSTYDQMDKGAVFPVPQELRNDPKQIYIMMGNIGPYAGVNNITSNPVKEQIVMCVDNFTYNEKNHSFIGGDDKVGSSCSWRCNTNPCHNGICEEAVYKDPSCDCRQTTFNGPFCNRSLRMFNETQKISYEKRKGTNNIFIKMTWRASSNKSVCLINIANKNAQVTIRTQDNQLIYGSSIIRDVDIVAVNVVIVNITNNNIHVQSRNKDTNHIFSLEDLTRINIGFTEGNEDCVTFEGDFDVYTDELQLWEKTTLSNMTNVTDVTNTTTTPINRPTGSMAIVLGSGACVAAVVFMLCSFKFVFYIWKEYRKTMRNIYDREYVDIPPRNVPRPPNADYAGYSTADYEGIYDVHNNREEDCYDYIPLKSHRIENPPPPLPKREFSK